MTFRYTLPALLFFRSEMERNLEELLKIESPENAEQAIEIANLMWSLADLNRHIARAERN